MPAPSIFVSYAHADAAALKQLQKHFAPLEREGLAKLWSDESIDFGADWDVEIAAALDGCRYAVPVLSAAFFASKYITGTEIPRLLERQARGEVELLPIFWSPCDEPSFEQVLPKGGTTKCQLSKWQGLGRPEKTLKDMSYTERERALGKFVKSLRKKLDVPAPSAPAPAPVKVALPVNNLPASLGDLFTGRAELLAELERNLGQPGATALVQAQTVSGLGGVGKTRLAFELAHRHAGEYSGIFFVNADSPSELRRNLAALSGRLLLDLNLPDTLPEDRVVEEVKLALRKQPGWLLILDNVDSHEAQQAVSSVLPLDGGHVLITSRLRQWPLAFKQLKIDKLDPPSAREYLLKATPDRPLGDDDSAAAAKLAEKLGCLPLALELTAAYLRENASSLGELLAGWSEEEQNLLGWLGPGSTEYPRSLAATWARSFEKLSVDAQVLLSFLGHLAPEPIAVALFEAGNEVLNEAVGGRELKLKEALADLQRYSLISREITGTEKTITLHRLVQAVARGRVPGEERSLWVERVLRLILAFAPEDPGDVRGWPIWDPLRPHATRVLELAEQVGAPEPASKLMNELGLLLLAKALYSEAEPLMRRALAIDDTRFGPDHPNVATELNNLAQLLKATDRPAKAEPLMRRALAIDEAAFGPDHPNVATLLTNLAQLLQHTDRLVEAEPLMRRALAITETSFGPDQPEVAIHLNNLAQLLQDSGRLAEAEPLMCRALVIAETGFGPDHPNVATALNNLALLLQDSDRLTEAELLLRRALAIDETNFGPDHPVVACRLNNVAMLLKATNLLAEAEPLMRRALAIEETSFGPDHSEVARALNNLALLLQDANRLVEAEPLMRRALAIEETNFGSDHPDVAIDLNNLATLLKASNRLTEAETLLQRGLAIFEGRLGADHPRSSKCRRDLEQLLDQIAREGQPSPDRPESTTTRSPSSRRRDGKP